MAKKAIAYGVTHNLSYPRKYLVLGITTETQGRSARIFGREPDGTSTSRAARDVYGRFATRELAEQACAAVTAVQEKHRPIIRAAEQAERDARQARDNELLAVFSSWRA